MVLIMKGMGVTIPSIAAHVRATICLNIVVVIVIIISSLRYEVHGIDPLIYSTHPSS